ncbi:helicase-related protein [Janibacter limosus]|uniref:helicase-related protein n=1 Tax=Janibacter limosus TaxID=53458 RepID=UPI0035DB6011
MRFAVRYGAGDSHGGDDARMPEVRASFNSPFWPFVLVSTSVGQEGIDFHWWCHAIMHWNIPPNPVDFEQREGRVDRFRGHAIRKNIADKHGGTALSGSGASPPVGPLRAGDRPAPRARSLHPRLGLSRSCQDPTPSSALRHESRRGAVPQG